MNYQKQKLNHKKEYSNNTKNTEKEQIIIKINKIIQNYLSKKVRKWIINEIISNDDNKAAADDKRRK